MIDSGQLQKVFGHQVLRIVRFGVMGGLGVTAQELQRNRTTHLEAKRLQDLHLHVEYLAFGVRVVGDVHKLLQLGRIHLLDLGGQKECGHTDQLQLLARRVFHQLCKSHSNS